MMTFTNEQNISLDFYQEVAQSTTANIWKRLFDILVAIIVTISVLMWLIPVIGLLIKLTSPGPVLFIQLRTGLNGKPFRCLKLRTMVHKQEYKTFKQTTFNDSRVTSIGQWLRRTNLDEMPQFLNVLMGHMSVVGPRPHAIEHDAEFWYSLPNYEKRYIILPGITGLAQVRGARGITDDSRKMQHRLRYDLFYIKTRSLGQDAQICWWTVKSMFIKDPNAW